MKYYNYLLFRIYQQMILNKENDISTILFLLTSVSTLFVYFTFNVIILIINYYFVKIYNFIFLNETAIIFYMFLIAFFNYEFFVKPKKFLNYNFNKDKKGGYVISIYLISIVVLLYYFGNQYRNNIKIEKKRLKQSEQINISKSSSR